MQSNIKEICEIVVLCLCWFSVSSTNNIITKQILNSWSHPLTLTLVQLCSIYVYLKPTLFTLRIERKSVKKKHLLIFIIPLSFGKFVASISSHFSLSKVSVSYSHTGKSPALFVFNQLSFSKIVDAFVRSRSFAHHSQRKTVDQSTSTFHSIN